MRLGGAIIRRTVGSCLRCSLSAPGARPAAAAQPGRFVAAARHVLPLAAAVRVGPSVPSSSTRFESPARNSRSCDTNSMVPSNSVSAAINISLVAMSRWLVGSSSTRKLGGSYSIRRQHQTRLLAARQHAAFLLHLVAGESEGSRPARAASPTGPAGTTPPASARRSLRRPAPPWRAGRSSPSSRWRRRDPPASGCVEPATSLSSVDLPAPLTPITHQRSLRRMEDPTLCRCPLAVAFAHVLQARPRPRRSAAPAGTRRPGSCAAWAARPVRSCPVS